MKRGDIYIDVLESDDYGLFVVESSNLDIYTFAFLKCMN